MTLLRCIDPRAFGVLLALSPAAGAGTGWLLLHEQLTLRQVCALTLIVVAGAWSLRRPAPGRSPAHRRDASAVRADHRCNG
jgi:inner membrane transporter RhtA